MDKEQNKKEGISVQEKQDPGRPRRSRSKAAFMARKEEQAREKAAGERRESPAQPQGTVSPQNRKNGIRTDGPPQEPSGICREAGKSQEPSGKGREAGETREPLKGGYWKVAAIVMALALAACAGGYYYRAMGYRDTYLPHTVINGMDVSGRSSKEVKDMISAGIRDYSLTLKLKGGNSESVSGEDIDLHTVFDGSLEEIIRQQNPYAWPRYLFRGPEYDIHTMIAFDQRKLEDSLGQLDCFDPALVTVPADAYLSDYVSGQGYAVVPEVEGNELDPDLVRKTAAEHVQALEKEADLEALGCYRAPSIRSDNSALVAARDARNRYVNLSVTYTFGSTSEVLDGETIHQWLVSDGQSVALDRDKISEYIKDLAFRHNTAYKKRSFQTSYGETVEVTGFYGWRINQKAELEELAEILEAGEDTTREPVYAQTAASHDGPDYGNTYAEVNLTAQHMFFYKDGEKILESDFVSGNVSRGHSTPPGIFALTYKQRDAVLKGEGYASPVKYWMPFNGGIGFHDASWRSSFGGSIYKSGGSHGCVNMPYAAAKQLFENVYAGMPVICYDLPGTESSKPSKASGTAPAPETTAPLATAPAAPPAQTQPEQTLPAQTQPAQTQPGQPVPSQPAPTEPQISIDPVGQSASPEGTQTPETTAGYGPAFQSPGPGDEIGPGV